MPNDHNLNLVEEFLAVLSGRLNDISKCIRNIRNYV